MQPDGRLFLVDFGLVKVVGGSQSVSFVRGLTPLEATAKLTELVFAGRLSAVTSSRTLLYEINE